MAWLERWKVHLFGTVGAVLVAAALLLGLMQLMAPSLLHGLSAGVFGRRGTLRIATAHASGAYHRLAGLLGENTARGGLSLQLRTSEGSLENLLLLREGHVDLAMIQGALPAEGGDLTALASLQSQLVHLVAPVTSDVHSFSDLAGKRIAVGGKQSGFTAVATRLIAFYGLPDPPTLVHVHVDEIDTALREGRVDAALLVYALFAPAMETLLADGAHRLVPLHHTEALSLFAPGMVQARIPDGAYGPGRSLPARPLSTLAVSTLLVARPDVSGALVWSLLRAVYSTRFISSGKLAGLDEARGGDIRELPLHPAAREFYARNAPISSDRFEIASFFIAASLAMASLARYVQVRRAAKRMEERRKRIVPYFEQLLDVGRRIQEERDVAQLSELVTQMMRTQHRAENEWLEGHLDTEHMENLYAVFDVRCRNAFDKMATLERLPPAQD